MMYTNSSWTCPVTGEVRCLMGPPHIVDTEHHTIIRLLAGLVTGYLLGSIWLYSTGRTARDLCRDLITLLRDFCSQLFCPGDGETANGLHLTTLRQVALQLADLCSRWDKDPPRSTVILRDIIRMLDTLMCHNDPRVLVTTMWSVRYVADNAGDEFTQMMPSSGILRRLVPLISHREAKVQTAAVRAVRKFLSSDLNPSNEDLLEYELLPGLVHCLQHTDPELQVEAVLALMDLASVSSEQIKSVVKAGAAPHFLRLLDSHHNSCEQALLAIGKIVGAGPVQRDCLINVGVITPLINLIRSDVPTTVIRNVSRVIVNICRDKNPRPISQALRDIIPALKLLIKYNDTHVLADVVWALSNLTDGANDLIQKVIDCYVLRELVGLLSHSDGNVQTGALRAVGNIVSGTDSQTEAVLQCQAVAHFRNLLNHPEEVIRKEAMRVVADISARDNTQVQTVIDTGLIPLIINTLENEETQTEAARAFRNLTSTNVKVAALLRVRYQVTLPLCKLLSCKNSQVIQVVLDGIKKMLKVATSEELEGVCTMIEKYDGLDKIKALLNHENTAVDKIAWDIIVNYFSDTDDMSTRQNEKTLKRRNTPVTAVRDGDTGRAISPETLRLSCNKQVFRSFQDPEVL